MKRFVISLLLIAVLIWAISPVMAEEELQSPGLLPDHPLYGVKRWSEGVHEFFTFDDGAKARLHTRFSEARLAEAKAMTELGKPEWAGGLMEEYNESMEEAEKAMRVAEKRGLNVTELAEHVGNMTYKHVEVLEALLELDKVPEQAKPHIEHAMRVRLSDILSRIVYI